MEKMYRKYGDIAAFYIVYISEAHAEDDKHPVPYAKKLGIKEHKTYADRCVVASLLKRDKKLTIHCLVDEIDNRVEKIYKGWPDRVFLIRKDGRLGVAGMRGPWGFGAAVNEAREWLAQYKKTGREPALPQPDPSSKAEATGTDSRDTNTSLAKG